MNILTYKGYQGSFDYDPDADIFHGDVLHINDVVTFQGRSIDELKKALADSVEGYLEFCADKGKTPEKPYSGVVNVCMSPELHQRIAQEAARAGMSLNDWAVQVLTTAVTPHS